MLDVLIFAQNFLLISLLILLIFSFKFLKFEVSTSKNFFKKILKIFT